MSLEVRTVLSEMFSCLGWGAIEFGGVSVRNVVNKFILILGPDGICSTSSNVIHDLRNINFSWWCFQHSKMFKSR